VLPTRRCVQSSVSARKQHLSRTKASFTRHGAGISGSFHPLCDRGLHMDSLLGRFVGDLALLADETAGDMRKILK
jgi:hypothetical protein